MKKSKKEKIQLTVLHLGGSSTEKEKIARLRLGIGEKLNRFFNSSFRASASRNFQLTVEFVSSHNQLFEFFFGQSHPPEQIEAVSPRASQCILFMLDFKFQNTQINEIPFFDYLHTLFPAIPKLILTSGKHENPPYTEFGYLSSEFLDQPQKFYKQLAEFFSQWWQPLFWETLLSSAEKTPARPQNKTAFLRDFFEHNAHLALATDWHKPPPAFHKTSTTGGTNLLRQVQKSTAHIFGAENGLYFHGESLWAHKRLLSSVILPGEIVILDRQSHISVHRAVIEAGAVPFYLPREFDTGTGLWNAPKTDFLQKNISLKNDENTRPRVLILHSGSAQGQALPLQNIARWCNQQGILLLTDEIWAAHWRFHPAFSRSSAPNCLERFNAADSGAHLIVAPLHKNLSVLGKALLILVSESAKAIFQETENQNFEWLRQRFSFPGKTAYESFCTEIQLKINQFAKPNYTVWAAAERAGVQMRLEGLKLLNQRLLWAKELVQNIGQIAPAALVEPQQTQKQQAYESTNDPLRIIFRPKNEKSNRRFKTELAKKNLPYLRATAQTTEFQITVATPQSQLQSLLQVVEKHANLFETEHTSGKAELHNEQVLVAPWFAARCRGQWVELGEAKNRIAAQMLALQSSEVPGIVPGMKITPKLLRHLKKDVKQMPHSTVEGIFENHDKLFVKVLTLEEAEIFNKNQEYENWRKPIKAIGKISRFFQ